MSRVIKKPPLRAVFATQSYDAHYSSQLPGNCCRTRNAEYTCEHARDMYHSMDTPSSLSCFDDQDLPAAIFSDGVFVEKKLGSSMSPRRGSPEEGKEEKKHS